MQHRGKQDRDGGYDQTPLHDRPPLGGRRKRCLETDLIVQIRRREKPRPSQLTAVGGDHGGDPDVAGDQRVTVQLHRAELGKRQLLLAHGLIEVGVVGGHRKQLGSVADRVLQGVVENHFPAGRDTHRNPGGLHHPGAFARDDIARPVGEPGQMPEKATPGQVFAEWLHDPLVVVVAGSSLRIPDDHRVCFSRGVRPAGVEHRADQDRGSDRLDGHRDLLCRVGVAQRVDLRCVLGPDDNVGSGRATGMHVVGQPASLPDIVGQHRETLRVELQTESGHVALNHRRGDDRLVTRSGAGVADLRPDGGGGEKHQADVEGGQHDRGWRVGDLGLFAGLFAGPRLTGCPPPRHGLQRDRGGAASGQHDRQ